jgi:hypothetical protein
LSVFATELTGQASIIDGDTLEINGKRIRLCGIDAPESDQLCQNDQSKHPCGQKVANDLDAFIARRPVSCVEVDRDRYRRAVAPSRVSTWRIGWCEVGWRSTGPNIRRAITLPHRTKQSAPKGAYGAAVLSSPGAIALAEEQADHL